MRVAWGVGVLAVVSVTGCIGQSVVSNSTDERGSGDQDAGDTDTGDPSGGDTDAGDTDPGDTDLPVRQPPPLGHPRLFRDDAAFMALQAPLYNNPCSSATSALGAVTNIRNRWDEITAGVTKCTQAVPASIASHPDAARYMAGGTIAYDISVALRVLHLIRRLNACHTAGGTCDYSLADLNSLRTNFITEEMSRFASTLVTDAAERLDPSNCGPVGNRNTNIEWCLGYAGWDLWTTPPVRYWSIFLDTLWDHLTAPDIQMVREELDVRVGALLDQRTTNHWSYANGNNWSVVLANGLAWYAIALYHEDPRAEELLDMVVESWEKHDEFYENDGSYQESTSYLFVSLTPILEAELIYRWSLNTPIGVLDTARMQATARWAVDFVASDMRFVNFGDAHDYHGFGSFYPLLAMLWPELIGSVPVGTFAIDPCFVRDFFMNKYFENGLSDPWVASPTLGRDWLTPVGACSTPVATPRRDLYPRFGAVLRSADPGATATGALSGSLRYAQADVSTLALSAVPNTNPHMELDFAALIWSAYGSRILSDTGYGQLVSFGALQDGSNYNRVDNPDYVPSASNTLIIPEAHFNNDAETDLSQVYGELGTVTPLDVAGVAGVDLDGSLVYGRDNDLGWLAGMHRFALPIGTGSFLVIDAFAVKSTRPDASPEEYFYGERNSASCHHDIIDVAVTATASSVDLTPRCSQLVWSGAAESVARVQGVSLRGGAFVSDGDVTIANRSGTVLASRRRFRFVPSAPQRDDVRAFLLVAAPSTPDLPVTTLNVQSCPQGTCVSATVGAAGLDVAVVRTGDDFSLVVAD